MSVFTCKYLFCGAPILNRALRAAPRVQIITTSCTPRISPRTWSSVSLCYTPCDIYGRCLVHPVTMLHRPPGKSVQCRRSDSQLTDHSTRCCFLLSRQYVLINMFPKFPNSQFPGCKSSQYSDIQTLDALLSSCFRNSTYFIYPFPNSELAAMPLSLMFRYLIYQQPLDAVLLRTFKITRLSSIPISKFATCSACPFSQLCPRSPKNGIVDAGTVYYVLTRTFWDNIC